MTKADTLGKLTILFNELYYNASDAMTPNSNMRFCASCKAIEDFIGANIEHDDDCALEKMRNLLNSSEFIDIFME